MRLSIEETRLRLVAYGTGTIVFVAALVYLFQFAARNWGELHLGDARALNGSWLALAAGAYALSLVTTSMAWPAILRALGPKLPLSIALPVSLAAQIGKYLPGNIAHYFGRAALAARSAVPIKTSAKSTAIEFVSALAAAALVSLAMIFADPRFLAPIGLGWSDGEWRFASIATAALLWLLGAIVAPRLSFLSVGLRRDLWAPPIGWLCLSFISAGISFFAVSAAIGGGTLTPSAAIAIFATAWAVGFAVPGAPAGLGVREAILVLLAAPFLTAPGALLCAVMVI